MLTLSKIFDYFLPFKEKITRPQSARISIPIEDLPHNRPFPGGWCKKKRLSCFSKKVKKNTEVAFLPCPATIIFRQDTFQVLAAGAKSAKCHGNAHQEGQLCRGSRPMRRAWTNLCPGGPKAPQKPGHAPPMAPQLDAHALSMSEQQTKSVLFSAGSLCTATNTLPVRRASG